MNKFTPTECLWAERDEGRLLESTYAGWFWKTAFALHVSLSSLLRTLLIPELSLNMEKYCCFRGNLGFCVRKNAMVRIFVSPQSSYVEVQMPSVMEWGGGASGKCLYPEGSVLRNEIHVLIKQSQKASSSFRCVWKGISYDPGREPSS